MKVTLNRAVKLIKEGETVAIPTETVYGLAADAFNLNAVKKIFIQKGRPSDNPLIVHISNLNQLHNLAESIPDDFSKLTDRFWPGPLSIVLKKKPAVPDIVTGGLDTVAIRMPNHSLTLQLIEQTGPLTAPSANKSGRPSPTRPEHISEDFGDQLPILDGGISDLGLESTVLDLSGHKMRILRPGFIHKEMIQELIGKNISNLDPDHQPSAIKSPGTRFTHYKPNAEVKWLDGDQSEYDQPETYIILHSKPFESSKQNNTYSYKGNYRSLAKDLYDHFRTADHLKCKTILIEPYADESKDSIIPALKDRIERAIHS